MDAKERMLARLPSTYAKGSDSNVAKLLDLPGRQVDDLNRTLQDVELWRDVDKAEGKVLDELGLNVFQPRGGTMDEVYRVLIKTKTLRTSSTATVPDLIRMLSSAFSVDPADIEVSPKWASEAGSVFISIPFNVLAGTGLTVGQFGRLCQSMVAGGVRAVTLSAGTFGFSSILDMVGTDAEAGFNSIGGDTGGYFGGSYDPDEDVELPI